LKTNKGSIVVEASLVFPVVFLAIIAVMYMCMLLYQKVYIQSIADLGVERGAATWSNPAKDTALGSLTQEDLKSGGLYWRLFDLERDKRRSNLKNYIEKRLGAFNILESIMDPGQRVSVEIVDYIIYKKLVVSVNERYKIPVGKTLRMFGLDENYAVSVRSEAVLNEPVEFIRNTDFILDVEKEFEKTYKEYGELISKIRSSMDDIQARIAKFFEEKEGSQ